MKKIVSLLLAVMLVGTLAACGDSGNVPAVAETEEAAAPAAAAADDSAAEAAPVAEAASSGPVELNYVTWRTEDIDVLNEMIAAFEAENPDIKVNMEITSNDLTEYYAVLKARLLSGEGADVFMDHPGPYLKELVDAGYCYEMEPELYANVTPGVLNVGQVDGKQYGLPETCNTFVTYYNTELFDELGIEVPTDYESLKVAAQKSKDAGYQPIAIGFGEAWVADILYEALLCDYAPENPNSLHDLETGDAALSDDLYKNVFGDVAKMVDDGIFQENLTGTNYESGISLFASGKATMLMDGNWTVATILDMNPDLKFGVMPIFNTAGQGQGISAAGQNMSISANTANLDAAKKFVEFFYSPEGEAIYCNATIQPSTVQGVTLDIPALQMLSNVMGSAPAEWPDTYVENSELMGIVEDLCVRMAEGGKNLDEEIAKSQTEIDALK